MEKALFYSRFLFKIYMSTKFEINRRNSDVCHVEENIQKHRSTERIN